MDIIEPIVAATASPTRDAALESRMRSCPEKLERSVLKSPGEPMAVKLAALRGKVACCQPELAERANGVVVTYPVPEPTKKAMRMESGCELKLSKSISMPLIPALT